MENSVRRLFADSSEEQRKEDINIPVATVVKQNSSKVTENEKLLVNSKLAERSDLLEGKVSPEEEMEKELPEELPALVENFAPASVELTELTPSETPDSDTHATQATANDDDENSDFMVVMPPLDPPQFDAPSQIQLEIPPAQAQSSSLEPSRPSTGDTVIEVKKEGAASVGKQPTSSGIRKPRNKARRLTEVFRLQKALETASWTDSVAIEAQTDVITISDDDSPPKTPIVPKLERVLRRPSREGPFRHSAVPRKNVTPTRSALRSFSVRHGRPHSSNNDVKNRRDTSNVENAPDTSKVKLPPQTTKQGKESNASNDTSKKNITTTGSGRKTSTRKSKASTVQDSIARPRSGATVLKKRRRSEEVVPNSNQTDAGKPPSRASTPSLRRSPRRRPDLKGPVTGKNRTGFSRIALDEMGNLENGTPVRKQRYAKEMTPKGIELTLFGGASKSRKRKKASAMAPCPAGRVNRERSNDSRKTEQVNVEEDFEYDKAAWMNGGGGTVILSRSKKRQKGKPHKLTEVTTDVLAESRAELSPSIDDSMMPDGTIVSSPSPLRRGRSKKSAGLTAADVGIRSGGPHMGKDAVGFRELSDGEDIAVNLDRNEWKCLVQGWVIECQAMREGWHGLNLEELRTLLCSPLGVSERALELIAELQGKTRRMRTGPSGRAVSDTERTDSSGLSDEDIYRKRGAMMRRKIIKG